MGMRPGALFDHRLPHSGPWGSCWPWAAAMWWEEWQREEGPSLVLKPATPCLPGGLEHVLARLCPQVSSESHQGGGFGRGRGSEATAMTEDHVDDVVGTQDWQ